MTAKSPSLPARHGRETDNNHTFGNILECNTSCDDHSLCCVTGAESHTCRNTLGQIVYGYCSHKQKHLAEA